MEDFSISLDAFTEKAMIFLIREELKSRKLFGGLRDLGLDDDVYQADLLEVIMPCIGFSWDAPKQYDFCNSLLRKHSTRVAPDCAELLNEARRVYKILCKQAARQGNDQAPLSKTMLKRALDPSVYTMIPSSSEMKQREISWQRSRAKREWIGERLQRKRQEAGLGIQAAAKEIGIPKRRLIKIERGTYVQFDLTHLKHICRCYGTSAEAFISNYIDGLIDKSMPKY
jgi:DNA-binding XRE family transcriptional regulator